MTLTDLQEAEKTIGRTRPLKTREEEREEREKQDKEKQQEEKKETETKEDDYRSKYLEVRGPSGQLPLFSILLKHVTSQCLHHSPLLALPVIFHLLLGPLSDRHWLDPVLLQHRSVFQLQLPQQAQQFDRHHLVLQPRYQGHGQRSAAPATATRG